MFAKPCDFPTSENVHQFFPFLPSVSQSSLKFSFVSEIEIENRFPQLVFLFTRKKNIDEPGEAWKLKVPTKRLMINTWIARGKRRLMSCGFHCGKKSQSHDRSPHPHLPPRLASAPQAVQVYMWLANLPMGSSCPACQWGAPQGKCTCGVAPYLQITPNPHMCFSEQDLFFFNLYSRLLSVRVNANATLLGAPPSRAGFRS